MKKHNLKKALNPSVLINGFLTFCVMLGFGFTGLQAQNVQPANFYNLLNGEATNEITLDPGDTFTWTVGINSTGGMDGVTITYDFPFELMQEDDELAVDLIPAFIFPVQNEVENETGYVSFTKTAVGTFITGTQDVAQWTYTIGDDVALGTVINIDHVTDPAVVLMSNIVYIGNEILDPEDAPGITIFIGEPVVFDCPELEANIGDACDDGDDNTENDTVNSDCVCVGTIITADGCTNDASFGSATVSTPDTITISTCVYFQEYSTISGILSGYAYEFTGEENTSGNLAYITVRSDSSDGPLVGAGTSPLSIVAPNDGVLYVHWNTDSECGTATSCATATAACITCATIEDCVGVPGGDAQPGTSCDDLDETTFDDVYDTDCNCAGTSFDCIELLANIGDDCDDLNPSTTSDVITEDCECVGTPAPDNDLCSGAIALVCGEVATGSTVGASNNTSLVSCGTSLTSAPGVWYSFSGYAGIVSVTTCSEGGPLFDTKLGVFSGSCDTLTCVGGDDDASTGDTELDCSIGDATTNRASFVEFEASAEVTYYIYVTGFSSNEGEFDLTVSCEDIVCFADAGTVTADENPVISEDGSATISATANGDAVVPEGFVNQYVLTSGNNLVIEDLSETPSFDVTDYGDYTIHSVVFATENAEAILAAIEFGLTTGGDVIDLVEELELCASLDVEGAPISVIPPPPSNNDCLGAINLACNDTIVGDTDGATASDLENTCGNFTSSDARDLFYSFDADGTSDYLISLSQPSGSTGFDGVVFVYSGPCDDLTSLGCADSGNPEEVELIAPEAGTYTVRIFDYFGTSAFTLALVCTDGAVCNADAGAIVFADSSTSVTVCVDDQDPSTVDVDFSELPTDSDDLAGTWVVTDADGNLLGLPSSMEDVENIDFDNAGAGNCLIWFLSFDPENSNVADLAASFGDGLDVNASELEGCFMLSNALEVVRENCGGEFDCPELEANIGDACDLAEGENGTINENCECVPAPDCENFMYYLSDHSAADGISDIYGVTLSGGVATMSYIATSETEVHIAFNEEDNNIYALSKFDNSYRVLDPSTGVFGPTVMLGGEYGEITAAVFNAEGKLVFGSQDNNAIYCVNVTTNVVTEYDSFAPVTGGDLAFGSDGMLYLATRSGGGGLYEVYPDDVMADVLIGSVANPVTGMAITDGDQLLVSTQGMMSLELYNTDGSSAMTSFMLDLDGEPYTLRDGDMASGCNTGDIVTSDCDNYATFYVNHGPDVDGSDLYSVDFIDGNAELNYITNVDFEAHIGYNPEEGLMYFVNKDGSIIRVYNVVTDAFEGDVAIVGGVVDQLTAVLYDSNDGELYVGDADSDVISSIDLNTGIPAFYANAPVFGGDISILNGTMYLARRNLNELYEVVPFGEAILIGSIPGGVNGMAPSPNPGNLVTSSASQNAFVEISATDGSTVTTWPATLDGSAFTFINGDMASGCIDNLPQLSFNFVETESVLSAYPNPTSGLSQVVFMTAQTGRTLVEVYDMNGRNVKTLFNQEAQKDQEYRLDFNGSYLPNGVYIYRLTTNNETIVEKFMIAK